MRVVVLHPYTKFEVRRPCHSEDMVHDVSLLIGLVALTFDRLTLKLSCYIKKAVQYMLASLSPGASTPLTGGSRMLPGKSIGGSKI